MANSPPDLVLVVVVEVVKEVLCSCLKVLEGWWKALVDVSLHSNTKVSAKRHCLVTFMRTCQVFRGQKWA